MGLFAVVGVRRGVRRCIFGGWNGGGGGGGVGFSCW